MTDRQVHSSMWERLATDSEIEKTIEALRKNGINATVVRSGEEAKRKVFEILPKEAEVMNMTSVTLDTIGVSKEIIEGNYNSIRKKFMSMDKSIHAVEKKR